MAHCTIRRTLLALVMLVAAGLPAQAQVDRLCDPANQDCRSILLNYIRNEQVAIDVAFWFMEDARYTAELIRKHQAGVPVRVLIDPRANSTYPLNASRLQELQDAGIPMRKRKTNYILHWKMMLFHGQDVVEFSGANYSANAWKPITTPNYSNYIDEAIYFTSDPSITDSFRTKFDDQWVNTTDVGNYANITAPLTRRYPVAAQDPTLNFPPSDNFRTRSVAAYNAERRGIDAIMYRITDRAHTDALLAAVARGIPVRLITEPKQYRDVSRLWHSWNVDRLYAGGVQIKHRAHQGLNHQKSVILYDQSSQAGDQPMVIFGSSNWTSPSAIGQLEHNIFARKPDLVTWFVDQFARKWDNTAGVIENAPFVPQPPDAPTTPSPAHFSAGIGTTATLRWYGGPWAHLYDVHIGTAPELMLPVGADLPLGPSESSGQMQSFTVSALTPGTTYYWQVVAKTMANRTRSSPIWSFTTGGVAPVPPLAAGARDIVLRASRAAARAGRWIVQSDGSAAGGASMRHPDAGAAKVLSPAASPAHYFELTFTAEAGRPYRLWIRGKADGNSWANDSVFVQFSGSVTAGRSPTWRIGTSSAAEVNLEECGGCGVAGWGWQDTGYGQNVLGPLVYFGTTGTQRIRIQTREDGLAIDQVVLSPGTFLSTRPGSAKQDATILPQ